MAPTVTLFEHETREFRWTDRDLASLERLRRAVGVEVLRPTVRGGEHALQATQHVGVVRLGHRTVQILPKMYRSGEAVSEQERAREATRNLLHLLAYTGKLSVREHSLAPLLQRDLDWFEILTRQFASHLTEEWQRGAYRGYQVIDDELPVLKGRWRIVDQLRQPERRHVFAVSYDEFTADNQLNRIFRHAVERLWHLTRDAENRELLGELRQWMNEVTLLPSVTASAASPVLITRLNERYAPLLNLARLFLDGGALQLAAGDLTTFAFVFDMNQLFEAFVVSFICRNRDQVLPPDLEACELLPQSAGAAFYLARHGRRPVFELKPDLVFRAGTSFPLLVDTKYKQLDEAEITLGVSQGDLYQMHAYAHSYDCLRVVLLYPQTAGMSTSVHRRFALGDGDKVVVAATLDLRGDVSQAEERRKLTERLRLVLRAGDEDE